jgi:HlyD family secretion protein
MKRFVIALIIVALLGGGFWYVRGRGDPRPAQEPARTARVARGSVTASVSSTGTLRPYAQVEVRSRGTGTVIALTVQEGDRVTKGRLLAQIDDRDARSAAEESEAQVRQVQVRLQQSRSQLDATRAQNAVRVRQAEASLATARARLAQTRAGTRPEEIDQARQAQRQAELAVDLARQNLDRTRDLFNGGLVARSQLDAAQNQYDVAQAQLRAAQSRLSQAQTGSRREDIAVVEAQVREAESNVAQARATRIQERALEADVRAVQAQVSSAMVQLRQARDRLGETRIIAPIDGVVSTLSVQNGQSVIGGTSGGGTLVMTIADVRVIQASAKVDESDIAQVRTGMRVRITADALQGKTFDGRVVRIAPQATVEQNVTQYTVIVDVLNPDASLRLGMSVDTEFIVTDRQGVLVVPAEAVRGKDAKVLILVDGETLRAVVVQTGATDGRQVEITTGVEAGDVVYLGPARRPAPAGGTPQQTVNPFQPQFQRGGGGGRR